MSIADIADLTVRSIGQWYDAVRFMKVRYTKKTYDTLKKKNKINLTVLVSLITPVQKSIKHHT